MTVFCRKKKTSTMLICKKMASVLNSKKFALAQGPFSLTRDAAQQLRMCKSESKKGSKNGCGLKVVEFSLNENYEN